MEFKTDSLNTKSRQALTRIGAVEEGTFRNHMVMPGGRIRHSVYFSITSEDWPTVKAHLEERMAAYLLPHPSYAHLPRALRPIFHLDRLLVQIEAQRFAFPHHRQ